MVIRGRMLCQEACKDPLSVMSLDQLHCECLRHEKFIRMLCVRVCLSQFSKASYCCNCPSGSPSVVSVWTDMWTLGVLQKQESEGEEALWLAGLAGRETPQQERGGLPRTAESRG